MLYVNDTVIMKLNPNIYFLQDYLKITKISFDHGGIVIKKTIEFIWNPFCILSHDIITTFQYVALWMAYGFVFYNTFIETSLLLNLFQAGNSK